MASRRGSVNIWLEMAGVQGHVAYPHLADNPAPKLVGLLAEALAAAPETAPVVPLYPTTPVNELLAA